MLVLTRKFGQSITIQNPRDPDNPVEIRVEEIRGDQVKLRVRAWKNKPAPRSELSAPNLEDPPV